MKNDWKGLAQDYGNVNFDFVLMTHIQDTSKQLSKLPHESIVPNMNEPVGTKYEDIIQSYCNMVEQFQELLGGYHDDEYTKLKLADVVDFKTAKVKFGHLMRLCKRCNFLFTKTRVKASGEDSG